MLLHISISAFWNVRKIKETYKGMVKKNIFYAALWLAKSHKTWHIHTDKQQSFRYIANIMQNIYSMEIPTQYEEPFSYCTHIGSCNVHN